MKADKRRATMLIWLTHNCLCWIWAVSGPCKIRVRLILTRWRPRASLLRWWWHQQFRWIPTQHGFLLQCSCVASANFCHSIGMNAQFTLFFRLRFWSFYTCRFCGCVRVTHLYGTWVSAQGAWGKAVLGQPTHVPVLLSVQWLSKPQLLLEVIFLLTFCFLWSDDGVLKADSTRFSFLRSLHLRMRWSSRWANRNSHKAHYSA